MGRISAERNWSRGYFHTKSKETNPAKLKISDISAVGIIAPRRRLWFFDLDWESGSMPPPPSLFSVQSRHHSLTSSISAQLRKRVSSSAGNKLTSVDGGGFVKSSFLPNYFHIKYVRHPRHLAGSQALLHGPSSLRRFVSCASRMPGRVARIDGIARRIPGEPIHCC